MKKVALPIPPPPPASLAGLLNELVTGEGFLPSALPGVRFMRSTRYIPRSPIAYEPGIFIVAQGRKTGFLGGRRMVYDPHHYLVLSLPLPFECETIGSPAEPLLAVGISVTPALVTELLLQMNDQPPANSRPLQAMAATPLAPALNQATIRLLESLRSPMDARVLGPQTIREIIYHALCGPLGHNLRALAAPDSHFGRMSRVLNRLHTDYAQPVDMVTLAREAGMSLSAFHARFKASTASSPLQYLKHIRLHKARFLMVNEGLSAHGAALQVGYESASQFSREFKRLFGDTPATAAAELRRSLTILA